MLVSTIVLHCTTKQPPCRHKCIVSCACVGFTVRLNESAKIAGIWCSEKCREGRALVLHGYLISSYGESSSSIVRKIPSTLSTTRAILYKFGGYAVWNGYFYKALDEELFINASPRPSEVRFALYSELEEWDKCSEMFQRNVLPRWDLKSGIEEDAEFFGLFLRGNECMSHNGEYSANLSLFRSIHPRSDDRGGTEKPKSVSDQIRASSFFCGASKI